MALGKRSVWLPPLKVMPKSLPTLPPMPAATIPGVTSRNGSAVIAPYDPSRIFEGIKVVKDMRQSGTERGEIQTGDGGLLGPGGFESRYRTVTNGNGNGKGGLTPLQMGLLAVGGFLLLGG